MPEPRAGDGNCSNASLCKMGSDAHFAGGAAYRGDGVRLASGERHCALQGPAHGPLLHDCGHGGLCRPLLCPYQDCGRRHPGSPCGQGTPSILHLGLSFHGIRACQKLDAVGCT